METQTMTGTAPEHDPVAGASTRLIDIDNGGTLTDVCVIAGDQVLYTKTLTTRSISAVACSMGSRRRRRIRSAGCSSSAARTAAR